jgi:hypothetical protein
VIDVKAPHVWLGAALQIEPSPMTRVEGTSRHPVNVTALPKPLLLHQAEAAGSPQSLAK